MISRSAAGAEGVRARGAGRDLAGAEGAMRRRETRDRQTERTRGHRVPQDRQLRDARALADSIARVMRFFPSVLRTTPPTMIDIDVVYSLTRKSTQFHLAATHPREESVG